MSAFLSAVSSGHPTELVTNGSTNASAAFGNYALAHGHTEALDVANMSAADRRKYFLRDEN